jgi:hypothetical protein
MLLALPLFSLCVKTPTMTASRVCRELPSERWSWSFVIGSGGVHHRIELVIVAISGIFYALSNAAGIVI